MTQKYVMMDYEGGKGGREREGVARLGRHRIHISNPARYAIALLFSRYRCIWGS